MAVTRVNANEDFTGTWRDFNLGGGTLVVGRISPERYNLTAESSAVSRLPVSGFDAAPPERMSGFRPRVT